MATDLHDKTILVTGAAKRLGRTISTALAAAGADVVLHYNTSQQEAETLATEIRASGRQAWCLQADLSDPSATEQLMTRAIDAAGCVDGLVNNASIFPSDTLQTVTAESLTENTQVNAYAPLVLTRALCMQEKPGAVVNLLDSRMVDMDREHASYHLSKRMLFSLTRMMALDYAPRIRVNAVAPGLVLPPPGETEEYITSRKHTNPLQSRGTPQEVAEAVLFLLAAPFVTGQVLFVDGGRHLRGSMYGV